MDIGLLILRLGVGLFMLLGHGMPKLLHFAELKSQFPDPIGLGSSLSLGLAILAEVVCSVAVILGFKLKYVCPPLIITMLVAAFRVHMNDPWTKKEFALLYAVIYVVLMFTGPGRYTADHFVTVKKR